MAKISIIIPVFGVEKYIERCARSLFEQTLDDIEYIFIDDCSPDNSVKCLMDVLKDYPNRSSQVIIHHMEQNRGLAAVRKWGMMNASGEYFIHCDSDDWVDVTMYEKLYIKAKESNADVVICDYNETDGTSYNRIVKGAHSIDRLHFIEGCLFQQDSWSLCNKLFRKSDSLGGIIYPTGNLGEDMATCIQLLLKAERIEYVKESLYYYFVNPSSITKKNTISHCANNYRALKDNTDLLISVIKKEWLPFGHYCISDIENYLRFRNLLPLLPIRHIPEFRSIWKQNFQFFPLLVLKNHYIPTYNKKLYFACLFTLFPFSSERASE